MAEYQQKLSYIVMFANLATVVLTIFIIWIPYSRGNEGRRAAIRMILLIIPKELMISNQPIYEKLVLLNTSSGTINA
jgi:hypothetical protein